MKNVLVTLGTTVITVAALLAVLYISSDKEEHDDKSMRDIAYNLVDINNVRFNGYSEASVSIADRIFTPELATRVKENLKSKSENKFISFEEYFTRNQQLLENAENDATGFYLYQNVDTSMTDSRIKEVNGVRGMYLSDIVSLPVNFIYINGIEVYVDVDTSDYIGSLRGNSYYNFELDNYYMIEQEDGNILRVKMASQDVAEPFVIEYTCHLDENNMITQVEPEELIYSKLLRVTE